LFGYRVLALGAGFADALGVEVGDTVRVAVGDGGAPTAALAGGVARTVAAGRLPAGGSVGPAPPSALAGGRLGGIGDPVAFGARVPEPPVHA
jgi:hypothetical protein